MSRCNTNASQSATSSGMVTRSGTQLPSKITVASSNCVDEQINVSNNIGQVNPLLPVKSEAVDQQPILLPMSSGSVGQLVPTTFGGMHQNLPALAMSSGATSHRNNANFLHSNIDASYSQQLQADKSLQLDLLALKTPLEKFSPLKHVPVDWLNTFERYCNIVCQSHSTDVDRFVINNLFTLFSDENDQKWLI